MPAAPSPLAAIDTSSLYRMPWTMADNGFSWLEPTRRCNLSCEYCYQRNDPTSVKDLAEIARERTPAAPPLRRHDHRRGRAAHAPRCRAARPHARAEAGRAHERPRARRPPRFRAEGCGRLRLLSTWTRGSAARRRIHLQSLIVMQPHDVLPNGEQDECDGCPNKTYWGGRLVSECRKEDYLLYGRPVVAAPRRPERAGEESPRA